MTTNRDPRRGRMTAYSVAVLAVPLALFLRWPLWTVMGNRAPFMIFFPVVMLAATWGGFGPGIFATGIASLAVAYFLLDPTFSFTVAHPGDILGLALFAVTGGFISHLA